MMMKTKFVSYKMIYWLERAHCILFGWKQVNPLQRESPQMEKIAKSETISQNHTQTTLGCVTIGKFFRSTIEYHANCKYKNRISSACFKRVAYWAIVSKDPYYFFHRLILIFYFCSNFLVDFPSLSQRTWKCAENQKILNLFFVIFCASIHELCRSYCKKTLDLDWLFANLSNFCLTSS